MLELYKHQKEALEITTNQNHVAYYHDMGLGKTFTGAEKMMQLGAEVNLVICQKSKIDDWLEHFKTYYRWYKKGISVNEIFDLTNKTQLGLFKASVMTQGTNFGGKCMTIGVINYELAFRRPELKNLENFTLMLDESSLIQNEQAKRSKFILSLNPSNVILLSGTPTGGKYEKLWSQLHLLGWKIDKKMFYNHYVDYHWDDDEGYPIMIVDGYKNEERLKRKMRQYGCHFLKTDEVFDLPEQVHQTIKVDISKEYRTFRKDSIVSLVDYIGEECGGEEEYTRELVGDTVLTKMLYERQLCGQYNKDKLEVFKDLVESTNDRLIVFYNFNDELYQLSDLCEPDILARPISIVNGNLKNLKNYDLYDNSITFIQYQAGAMGLNLQKANKIVYFTPPLSSELFEQSKKRIHRIGQDRTCFYYYLTCKGSIEEKIYATLAMRKDYTEALFEMEEK